MPGPHRRPAARTALVAPVVAAALAYAWLLAGTRPFTPAADALAAVGLAAGVAGLTLRLVAARPAPAGPEAGGPRDASPPAGRSRTVLPWVALLAVVVAWELFCYVAGPRVAHPTLSSLSDLAARYQWLKALMVLAWLWLGWELVRP